MRKILEWGTKSKLFKYVLIEADLRNNAAMKSLKKLGFQRVINDVDEDEIEAQSTKYYKKVGKSEENEDLDFDT
jgi:hypothetical protein